MDNAHTPYLPVNNTLIHRPKKVTSADSASAVRACRNFTTSHHSKSVCGKCGVNVSLHNIPADSLPPNFAKNKSSQEDVMKIGQYSFSCQQQHMMLQDLPRCATPGHNSYVYPSNEDDVDVESFLDVEFASEPLISQRMRNSKRRTSISDQFVMIPSTDGPMAVPFAFISNYPDFPGTHHVDNLPLESMQQYSSEYSEIMLENGSNHGNVFRDGNANLTEVPFFVKPEYADAQEVIVSSNAHGELFMEGNHMNQSAAPPTLVPSLEGSLEGRTRINQAQYLLHPFEDSSHLEVESVQSSGRSPESESQTTDQLPSKQKSNKMKKIRESPKDSNCSRRRSAPREHLHFVGQYCESGPWSRIRVWKNERNQIFYDCMCGRRVPIQHLKKIKHHAESHDVNLYICDTCGREFDHYLKRNAHQKTHKYSIPTNSPVCPASGFIRDPSEEMSQSSTGNHSDILVRENDVVGFDVIMSRSEHP